MLGFILGFLTSSAIWYAAVRTWKKYILEQEVEHRLWQEKNKDA